MRSRYRFPRSGLSLQPTRVWSQEIDRDPGPAPAEDAREASTRRGPPAPASTSLFDTGCAGSSCSPATSRSLRRNRSVSSMSIRIARPAATDSSLPASRSACPQRRSSSSSASSNRIPLSIRDRRRTKLAGHSYSCTNPSPAQEIFPSACPCSRWFFEDHDVRPGRMLLLTHTIGLAVRFGPVAARRSGFQTVSNSLRERVPGPIRETEDPLFSSGF